MATAHAHPTPLPATRPGLRRLWDGAPSVRYCRGEYLHLPGDPARSVSLLRTGAVRLGRLLDSGRDLTLDVVGPGAVVGADGALGEAQRSGLAQAVGAVEASVLPLGAFQAAVGRSPEMALDLARMLSERARRLEARAVEAAFGDCPRRLARVLADLAGRFGEDEAGGRRIALRVTHEDLARLIGAARETVTPLLVQWRARGVLDYDRRRIVVRDLGRLLGG